MKRFLLVLTPVLLWLFLFKEEDAKDWGDKFDVKFMIGAYGEMEESSGEGDTSIDD